jgi:hypothetical protein
MDFKRMNVRQQWACGFDLYPFRYRWLIVIGCVGLFLACGVKKPPLPPRHKSPPPVERLEYHLHEAGVTLSWRLSDSAEDSRQYAQVAYYRIYRSTIDIDRPACDTCPVLFKKIAEVSVPAEPHETRSAFAVSYREIVTPGLRYHYKVTACSVRDDEGKASNVVEFDYK